jgi:hypothetical protein
MVFLWWEGYGGWIPTLNYFFLYIVNQVVSFSVFLDMILLLNISAFLKINLLTNDSCFIGIFIQMECASKLESDSDVHKN